MEQTVAIEVAHLAYEYETGRPVLVDVSFGLHRGACLGLLGANGSGKTTLLNALTGLLPSAPGGDLRSPVLADVGYATQDIALYDHLSVMENLEHAARLATGRWDVGDLVQAACDDFDLGEILPRRALRLSGGQRRLAHLACSFVHQPFVRLLDEPTAALDFEARQQVVRCIRRWTASGSAVLLTSHYPEDIEDLCSEVMVLVRGRTVSLGSLGDLLSSNGQQVALTVDRGSGEERVVLGESVGSIASLAARSESLGVRSTDTLLRIESIGGRLRDLLTADERFQATFEERNR